MAVHASISLGLDFTPGMALSQEIWRSFRRTVHPTERSGHFIMVVSFARSSFRLDEDNVGLFLKLLLEGIVLRSRYLSCVIVYSPSMSLARMLGFSFCINDPLCATILSVSFIFGDMGVLIGSKSLSVRN